MTDFDTIRWGDSATINLDLVSELGGIANSVQVCQAKWRRPITWTLALIMTPQMKPGETITWLVEAEVIIGCGSAIQTLTPVFTFAPSAGVYVQQRVFLQLPAQDMQVRFLASPSGAPTNPTGQSFLVSAMAAPFTEPAASAEVADLIRAAMQNPPGGAVSEYSEGLPRWMGPGFEDGELRYRR